LKQQNHLVSGKIIIFI